MDELMDELIEVPQEVFLKLAVLVCRAVVMVGRVREKASTGPDAAQEIDDLAYGYGQRVYELLGHLADKDQREALAKAMGWPSAGELMTFLSEGVKEGGVH